MATGNHELFPLDILLTSISIRRGIFTIRRGLRSADVLDSLGSFLTFETYLLQSSRFRGGSRDLIALVAVVCMEMQQP